MTEVTWAPLGAILLVVCLIAMLSRRIGLPYSVGLLAGGLLLALTPDPPDLPLSRTLIFDVLLPPLVFEAALQLEWRRFRNELPLTLTLALSGVAIAAAVVAAGMHFTAGWSWIGALLFGTLIAATDPVSVIALFREIRAERRLSIVVESESLLNDGVAAVGFAVLAAIAAGASPGAATVVPAFMWSMGGGVVVGLIVSGLALLIAGRTDDHLVEITLTTIAAYASFLIAERLHASGVMAALTAGLVIGNIGSMGAFTDKGRPYVLGFWEYVAFLANSLVFILIGMHAADQPLARLGLTTATAAIGFVLLGRLVSVYPLSAAFQRSRWAVPSGYRHVLFWGGLRGALALALALALPPNLAERQAIITTAFIVVAFSILVQGLTMPWLVKRLDLGRKPDGEAVAATAAAS